MPEPRWIDVGAGAELRGRSVQEVKAEALTLAGRAVDLARVLLEATTSRGRIEPGGRKGHDLASP